MTAKEIKGQFILQNMQDTIDLRTQNVNFLNSFRQWFITSWIAILTFVSSEDIISFTDSLLIMYSLIFLFWIIHQNWLYRKRDISDMIRQFESFIITATDGNYDAMTGPLLTIYKPYDRKHKFKNLQKNVFSWIQNDIYYIAAIVTFPILHVLNQ